MKNFTLAAFSAERRIAAVALFQGLQIENTHLRHLPVDTSKALGSVRELVTRTLERTRPEFIAISVPSSKAGIRTRGFCQAVKDVAAQLGIPAITVEDTTLMRAYAHPPFTRKEHVRNVGRSIWPSLSDASSSRAAVDAATTGLYVQTERLFSLQEEEAV